MAVEAVIESVQKKIEESKKADPMLSDDYHDTKAFELGIQFGLESMYEYLSEHYELTKKDSKNNK